MIYFPFSMGAVQIKSLSGISWSGNVDLWIIKKNGKARLLVNTQGSSIDDLNNANGLGGSLCARRDAFNQSIDYLK